MPESQLFFRVTPHIVEDLGLNLYTDLPKVLVEFLANAFDADAKTVRIEMDFQSIADARDAAQKEWLKTKGKSRGEIPPLSSSTLSSDVTITIVDNGHGMSRTDIAEKFLVAGRRRREADGSSLSPGKRMVMGRKGLGKLAGFGVAHKVTVISKMAGSSPIQIDLDYEKIRKHRGAGPGVPVDETRLESDPDIGEHGTKIILSRLVFEPMKSRDKTIATQIGDHFSLVHPKEFKISLNGSRIVPTKRKFIYAYPNPDKGIDELVEGTIKSDEGIDLKFKYRIRFTEPNAHLTGTQQGVRVYAHQRLACAPSLLDLHTGIHGFRWTHYLDGIVEADFIDEDKYNDYISTDRQSLRWETSNLTRLREHLTTAMKGACDAYQKQRESTAEDEIKNDKFTQKTIKDAELPAHKRALANKIAKMLSTASENGVADREYKTFLPILVDGLGQGTILTALKTLAAQNQPALSSVLSELVELTENQLGDFVRIAEGRIAGVTALETLVKNKDFKQPKNENELFLLLKKCPWLIDPTFFEFLTANQDEESIFDGLAKELKIDRHADKKKEAGADKPFRENRRPDLTFLLGSSSLSRLVIVELKAPNTPLHIDHLMQLDTYINRAESWLAQRQDFKLVKVSGHLIGSYAPASATSDKVVNLRSRIKKAGTNEQWMVSDLAEVLQRTRSAHKELLEAAKRLTK